MELIQQLIKDMAELKDENAALRNKLDKVRRHQPHQQWVLLNAIIP